MTHAQLAEIARRWLLRAESAKGPGCNLALKEVGALWVNRRGHVRVLSGHVTSSFAVLAWDTEDEKWVMRHALRDYFHFWRNDCDVVVERSMLTNLLLRLGDDPDALLQQLREQRRLNNQRSDEIERLKKQARDVDFRHYAMYRALVDNGLAHLIPSEK